ncbi:hypothetical protein C8R48DRAFT_703818 [Suillus tomentosus]|nr:hypothetical protein C8R48DRAFT_703818 [Suillus tomentosus]
MSAIAIITIYTLIRGSSSYLLWRGKLDPRANAQGVMIPAKGLTKTEYLGSGLCNEWRIEAKRYMGVFENRKFEFGRPPP